MPYNDYFDFLTPEDIRLKGTRIGIETILYEYIYNQQNAETIAQTYSNLTLEQVYITILYYLQHQKEVTEYLQKWLDYCQKFAEKQDQNPNPAIIKMLDLKSKQKVAIGV